MKINKQKLAEFAAMCIDALDERDGMPLTITEISREKGIPIATCADILHRLDRAGIVRLNANQVVLIREDITALEVVEAVWKNRELNSAPQIRMLGGFIGGVQIAKTLEFLSRSLRDGTEACNG